MDANVGGQIHGISLSAFLQMSEMETTTATLKVVSGNKTGYLYLLKGELIAAQMGELKNEDAAFEIISWEDSVIEIEERISKTEKEIHMPLMNILMEGLKIKDEKAATPTQPPKKAEKPPSAPTTKKPPPPPEKPKVDKPAPKKTKKAVQKPPGAKAKKPAKKEPAQKIKKIKTPLTPEKKRLLKISSAAVAAIVLIIAGIITWLQVISPMLLEKELNKVITNAKSQKQLAKKEQILKEYIDSHSVNQYTEKAENELQKIRKLIDGHDFKTANENIAKLPVDENYKNKATAIYRKYLSRHPDGLHTTEIKKRLKGIPGLIDDNDYDRLLSIDRFDYDKQIEAYNAYLKYHKEGKHVEVVKTLLSELSDVYYNYLKKEISECNKQNQWQSCIALCDTFIDNYQESKRLRQVKNFRRDIRAKNDFSDLQKAAKLKGTDYHAARQIYTQYLEKNPRSPVMRRINGKINQLDKKISDKKDYDALVSFCKNRQLDIFQRIDKLETYMKENPSGFYIKNAKTLMKHLQKEKKEYLAYQQMIENQREKEAQRLAAIQREKERIQSEKEKITTQLKQGSNRYKIDPNGYVTDTQTGLMWCLLDSHAKLQACMDYEAAQNYVKTLEIGGYKDWRLPSPNDLLVIFINKPYFPATGAKQYWSSEAYWKGSHEMVTIVENKGGNRWQRQQVDKGRCCSVRAVRP